MLESYPFTILLGIILGFLSGLGTGGGSLLILWLTLVMELDPQTARAVNLLFFPLTHLILVALALQVTFQLMLSQKKQMYPSRP